MSETPTLLSFLSSLQVRFFTWRRGELVGTDRYGNRYFRERKPRQAGNSGRERRWVLYAGAPDASKVPPEWFGWLHRSMDAPLGESSPYHQPWVKEHKPNLSGTVDAYLPSGHTLTGGRRAKATGDYEPWLPS